MVKVYFTRVINGKRAIDKIEKIVKEEKKEDVVTEISFKEFRSMKLDFYSTTNQKNDAYKKRVESYK